MADHSLLVALTQRTGTLGSYTGRIPQAAINAHVTAAQRVSEVITDCQSFRAERPLVVAATRAPIVVR